MTSRMRVGVVVSVVAMAAALAAGTGLWRTVSADSGLSALIDVLIFDPEEIELTVYSPGAEIPDTLPVGVSTVVRPQSRGAANFDDITSVVTVLGGDLDGETGTITDDLDQDTAILVNESGSSSEAEYAAVIDLARLDFQTVTRGFTDKFASDVIRTVAIAENYYNTRNVSDIVEADEIGVEVELLDSATIDDDGNGIPDASALTDSEFILIGENGVITIVTSLDVVLRGETTETSVTHTYDTAGGPVRVTVTSPTLAALQLADDEFDAFTTARLLISIAGDDGDLVDAPIGTDPTTEFDLVDGIVPLPAPRNIFVRAAIALASSGRGIAPVAWTFVDQLPGGLEFTGELSGPGIAEALDSGTDVGAYTYGVTLTQDGEDIIAEAGNDAQEDPWAEVETLTINNNESADDDADRIAEADDGDDTIVATFSIGSAIFGSNVIPRAGEGGGGSSDGNGWCFIATAAYGTPLATEIQTLRDVRDGYMVNNALGAAFVDAYYRLSPPLAHVVAENEIAKQGVRVMLAPVIAVSKWYLASPGITVTALLALMALCAAALGRRPIRKRATK